MHTKSILESKTFWLNLVTALAAFLVELSTVPDLGVDPKWILIALALLNIVLRTLTTQPVNVVPKPDPLQPPNP